MPYSTTPRATRLASNAALLALWLSPLGLSPGCGGETVDPAPAGGQGGAAGDSGTGSAMPDAGPLPDQDAALDADEPALPPSGGRIFATVSGSDEVLVLEEGSHAILSHIPVGQGPAILLATPDRAKLFSANWADNTISAIDVASEEVTSIALAGRPYVIAIDPAGDFVYAGLNPNGIVVIDTATDSIARTFETNYLAASLILSPDGATLYVATVPLLAAGTLRALDAMSGEEQKAPITVGNAPAWIAIHPDGSEVYTLNFLSDDISVVDTATWSVAATISTGVGSQAIIGNLTPDGSRLYVTNHGTGELMAIDTETRAVVQTIPIEGRPVGVICNADGSRVYTTDFGPESLAVGPDAAYLLTGNLTITTPGRIRVFDTASGEPVGSAIEVGPGPTSVIVQEP